MSCAFAATSPALRCLATAGTETADLWPLWRHHHRHRRDWIHGRHHGAAGFYTLSLIASVLGGAYKFRLRFDCNKEFSQHRPTFNDVDRGVIQAIWEELADIVAHRDRLIINFRTLPSFKKSLHRIDLTDLLADAWLLDCFVFHFNCVCGSLSILCQLLEQLRLICCTCLYCTYIVYLTCLWRK